MSSSAPASNATGQAAGAEEHGEPEVLSVLRVSEKRIPFPSLLNVEAILARDSRWRGRLRWSLFDKVVIFDGRQLRDTDLSRIGIWIDEVYSVRASPDTVHRAVELVSEQHAFHGPRDWLASLTWDGVPRLDLLLTSYFGVEDTMLHRRFSSAWLIGAVARVCEPGCKLDTMLVLIGGQGLGKSEACAAMMPDRAWFGDTTFDIGNKDAYMSLHGKWMYELAECEALKRASDEARKAFITSRFDRYRKPYGRLTEDHPRQVVFVATTNIPEFLSDPTGARRFWPVLVGGLDLAGLQRDRAQLFAEAVVRYRGGEAWYLDAHNAAMLVEAQRQFEVPEAWENVLAPWVKRQESPFSVEDALREGMSISPDRWDERRRQRVGKALGRLGCTRTRPWVDGKRCWMWVRPDRVDL